MSRLGIFTVVILLLMPVVLGLIGALGLLLSNYLFDLGVTFTVGKCLAAGLLIGLIGGVGFRIRRD